jgi:pimeloyl-ACP methyl ester carboxylesterase
VGGFSFYLENQASLIAELAPPAKNLKSPVRAALRGRPGLRFRGAAGPGFAATVRRRPLRRQQKMDTIRSTEHTHSINGIEMYCEVRGQGEPLLFLSGFTGLGADWDYIFKSPPVDGFQLILPDARGHGRSTNPSGLFTFRQSALDIFALLDQLKIDRLKAIGLSAGAKTLLHMATQQPERIEAMVLVSATPYFPQQARVIMRNMTVESHTEEEWALMRQRHRHGDDQIRALWRQANGFAGSYDDINFTPPYLSTITARTLIVHGDRDPFYPANLALEMYTSLPRSYLWIIPNAGHGPIFGDASPRFVETALPFLRGDWEHQS